MLWQVLIEFVFRLAFGLTAAMAVTSARDVTSGFFRVHLWVGLGLNTFSAAVVATVPTQLPESRPLLLISILANAFFTSRDTSEWWSERNAAKFMTRIGVGPNPIMGKSIFLKDLDDALAGSPVIRSEQWASKW